MSIRRDSTTYYRAKVRSKIAAYHKHMALGNIAHGLMMHLSINYSEKVWKSFNGFLRTIRPGVEPSILVTSNALTASFSNYLRAKFQPSTWEKIVQEKQRDWIEGELDRAG